ncbi:MAG: lasso peptide biosynthesis B2 protein [Clostridium perfringens]|nr:lasso peptide biosynthesis B2 protein [Clostridium perfringens]
MFFEAYILSGMYRFTILVIPFKRLRKHIGKHKVESSEKIPIEDYKVARQVLNAVDMATTKTPWESKCLVRALTTQRMLKKRKVYTTLYLGVGKDGDNKMLAHAWLRCGEIIVTGGEVMHKFQEVAKFSNEY